MTAPDTAREPQTTCARWTKPLGRDCPRSDDGLHYCTTPADARHEIHGCACNWVWGGQALPGPVIDELAAMRTENEELVRENEMHRERLRELGPLVAAFTEDDLLGTLTLLRANIARLVVAITGSWPGDQVFSDRQQLAHVIEVTLQAAATVKSDCDKHATEVRALRSGEDKTPTEKGVVLTAGQMWRRLLEAGHDERLRLLNALINQTRQALSCFEQDHVGLVAELRQRPTRHAFDEVCRSVELQRAALAAAVSGVTFLGPPQPFDELIRRVREVVERDAMSGFDEKSVQLQCNALADALGMDRGAWAPLIEEVGKWREERDDHYDSVAQQLADALNIDLDNPPWKRDGTVWPWAALLAEVKATITHSDKVHAQLALALGIDPKTAAWGAASWEAMIERVAKLASDDRG